MFRPTKERVNKVNLSSFELFQIRACVISARKAKQLDATTMFTYSHANTPLGQSERAYYLSYFINTNVVYIWWYLPTLVKHLSCSFIKECMKLTCNRGSSDWIPWKWSLELYQRRPPLKRWWRAHAEYQFAALLSAICRLGHVHLEQNTRPISIQLIKYVLVWWFVPLFQL